MTNIDSSLAFLGLLLTLFTPLPVTSSGGSLFGSDCGNNKSHNFKFGNQGIFDKLLYADRVKEESKWMRKISKDVVYPATGQVPVGYITYMEVLDQYNDGNGGCAFLTNGGIGQNSVSFHIKSQRSQGFDFLIKIYGLDNVCVNKH